jgi:hypothetical protein
MANIDIVSVSIPSSALEGAAVPVSITLQSLVIPATMYAMRATGLYTKYPYDGTAPTTVALTPTAYINTALGDAQVFAGSFMMPAWSVNMEFAVEYQALPGDPWVTEGYQSGIVTMTSPAPTPGLDMGTLMSMMVQMMIVVMMMKMMTGAMSAIK